MPSDKTSRDANSASNPDKSPRDQSGSESQKGTGRSMEERIKFSKRR